MNSPASFSKDSDAFRETRQRVHHYGQLIARWRRVARVAGVKLRPFATADGYACYCLATPDPGNNAAFLSAGIHGDEPAGPEALVRWAEGQGRALREKPLLLFPCLNPWGLVNNQRTNAGGIDLNRTFDRDDIEPIGAMKKRLLGRRFEAALTLHEDYDALGIYLYEISRHPSRDAGRALLDAGSGGLPLDARKTIEGRRFDRGLMLRRARLREIPLHPEAIHLYLHHTDHALTFETPSEGSLALRVEATVRVIEAFCARLKG